MHAFWTIVGAVQNGAGAWQPDLPALADMSVINPLDIFTLRPHPTDPNGNHRHLLMGGFAFPSTATGYNHSHAIVAGNGYYQAYHVGVGTAHSHEDLRRPEFFMCFVKCSDATYTALAGAPYNVRIVAEAAMNGEEAGDLPETLWDAGTRTFWQNAFTSNLGLQLPPEIERGKRLVLWVLGAFQGRRPNNDRGLRG